MPVIDGEKWACSSCIKGHRVSGCNHNDRELHHINPKGRPVKQCEHCRGARKSKSHHAKCDCGDKNHKDKHRDKVDAKVLDGRCHCHSGAKCMCGMSKDVADLKVDTSRQTLHDARAKPKLLTTHSEPHLTVFANGHHKPCHRNNISAHVSGAPYKIPRPHTLHGHSAFAALAQCNNNYPKQDVAATRSMDTLSLSNNDFYAMFGSTPRSAENLPMTNVPSNLESMPYQDSLFTGSSNTFGQDGPSPSSNSDTFPCQQWPWPTAAVTPVNSTFAYGGLSSSPSHERLPNVDADWAIPSAGFNPLWSAGDLPLNPSKFNDNLAQPISHSGESKQSGPGLTAASSAHSEIGESNPFGDLDFRTPPSAASESLFWEDSPVYRLNTSAPGESIAASVAMSVTSMPSMPALDSTFAKSLTSTPPALTSMASTDCGEAAAIAIPSNFDDVMAVEAWPVDASSVPFGGLNGFELSYPNNWF